MGTNGRGRIMHNSSTTEGWNDLLVGEWQECSMYTQSPYDWGGSVYVRYRVGGIDLRGDVENRGGTGLVTREMFTLPEGFKLRQTYYAPTWTTTGILGMRVGHANDGRDGGLIVSSGTNRPGWTRFNLFIPDYYLAS